MAGKKKKLCTRYTKIQLINTCASKFRPIGGITEVDRVLFFYCDRYANSKQYIDSEIETTARHKTASITTGPCEII